MWKQWLVALILVAVAAGAAVLYQSSGSENLASDKHEQPASVVNVMTPAWDTVRDVVKAVGSLKARHSIKLVAEVSGRVVALNLNPGHQVNKGDILVRLDDRQIQADLQVIEARLADAGRQLERALRLRSNNSVSEAQVDELRTSVHVANAQRQAVQVQLGNHRIEAPFQGVVGLSDISVGAYVSSGMSLTTLDATDQMELNFAIPERFTGEVNLGQKVHGTSPAYPDQVFAGHLSELDTRINELSRALPVRASIDNSDGKLRPGQFMSVTLTLRERRALVIPEQAIMVRGNDQYVFVAEDGVARRVSVTLGTRMPGLVEVADGLTEEDAVIVTGQDRLSSGDRIDVSDDENAIPDNRFIQSMDS
jgi:membrane fusion protein (multidrug efflux system)